MAVVGMSKLRIIGLREDNDKILETLTRSHCYHISETQLPVPQADNSQKFSESQAKQARVRFAIDHLLKQDDKYQSAKVKPELGFEYQPIKKQSLRPAVSADEFFGIAAREAELLNTVREIDEIVFEQNDITHSQSKIKETIAAYRPFDSFPYKFSDVRDTKKTFSALFSAPPSAKLPAFSDTIYSGHFGGEKNKLLFVVALNEEKDSIIRQLNERGFMACPFKGEFTAAQAIGEQQAKDKELAVRAKTLFEQSLRLTERLKDLQILYDYYAVMQERFSLNIGQTGYITVLEGWCPTESAERVKEELLRQTECIYFDVSKPAADEQAPTLLKNGKLVEPFEDLTAMYATPDYREKDPNLFMGFWYFFMFGIMCGDFVYGLMITVGCLVFLKVKKFERGMTRMIKMFAICGVSSMLWGIVFGSFLGQPIPVPFKFFTFADKADPSIRYLGWFSTMDEPIKMLGLALAVGMLHLFFAFSIKFVIIIKEKKPFSALFDAGFNLLIILGIILLGSNIFYGIFTTGRLSLSEQFIPDKNLSAALSKAGLILLGASLGGIFLTAGREALKRRKFAAWFGMGLNGINGGLIGLISDILSYSRLFGLGLAGGAIAFAFNTLVQLLFYAGGSVPMIIIGSVLLLFLHIFNLAIGLLGTYVHNARLQFLEYYGKFLVGDGKPFVPLGSNTRYIRVN